MGFDFFRSKVKSTTTLGGEEGGMDFKKLGQGIYINQKSDIRHKKAYTCSYKIHQDFVVWKCSIAMNVYKGVVSNAGV